LWQVLQLISQLEESRGSKNSIFPNSTLAGLEGFVFSVGAVDGMGLKAFCAFWSTASPDCPKIIKGAHRSKGMDARIQPS
jgi:hypothetical protein